MRYLFLLLLNIPIIIVALLNIITKYKTRKITPRRFRIQSLFWIVTLTALVASYPLYNHLVGNRVLDSDSLTVMDIVQVTAIVYLVYSLNSLRLKSEQADRRLQDLHQELSIKLSSSSNR